MRWLSRDPLGESGGLNLDAYCRNDPINKIDPLGLKTACALCQDWEGIGNSTCYGCRSVWEDGVLKEANLLTVGDAIRGWWAKKRGNESHLSSCDQARLGKTLGRTKEVALSFNRVYATYKTASAFPAKLEGFNSRVARYQAANWGVSQQDAQAKVLAQMVVVGLVVDMAEDVVVTSFQALGLVPQRRREIGHQHPTRQLKAGRTQ